MKKITLEEVQAQQQNAASQRLTKNADTEGCESKRGMGGTHG